jgi:hypothetical protein
MGSIRPLPENETTQPTGTAHAPRGWRNGLTAARRPLFMR